VTLRGSLGDANSSLGDATSSLGDAESSLGDAEGSLGDSKSSLGDAESSLGDAESSLGDAKRLLGDADRSLGDDGSSAALDATIREAASGVDQHLLDVMVTQFKLLEHCSALKRYLLLGQGDFIQALLSLVVRASRILRRGLRGSLEPSLATPAITRHLRWTPNAPHCL
jgi:hypothetical protein